MSARSGFGGSGVDWSRADWLAGADRLLAAVAPYRSASGARVDLPGPASRHGRDSDALEGYARTFLAVGFRAAGERGADPDGLLQRYAEGLAAGTDPHHPEAWPRPDVLGQAKVEAASIALVLQLTRPWLWDHLDSGVQERALGWLGSVVGQPYPPINWVWFRVVVESFCREAGGSWSRGDVEADLTVHASLRRAEGWLSDGAEHRGYDHYVGWALHLYPLLWTELFDVTGGPDPLCPPGLVEQWRADLGRYLSDALLLLGGDGSPLLQGRSLTYRYAAAAPFWMGGWSGVLEPGTARAAASRVVAHFDRDTPQPLPLGWQHPWPAMRQSYSGPASPYWAAKGLLGLALPAEHPVWTAPAPAADPAPDGDALVRAPGWLVSRRDGLVTVLNHGTDHAAVGEVSADSSLYARLGYSGATIPPLVGAQVASPLDNAVVLIDAAGRATHRTGFETLRLERDGRTLVGVSRGPVRWVDSSADTSPDHGSGRRGAVVEGPVVSVASLLRDGLEVRLARVEPGGPETGAPLRLGGWPVSAEETAGAADEDETVVVRGAGLVSLLRPLLGLVETGVETERDVTPLAGTTATGWLTTPGPAVAGESVAAVVGLCRDVGGEHALADAAAVGLVSEGAELVISWPDGTFTRFRWPA